MFFRSAATSLGVPRLPDGSTFSLRQVANLHSGTTDFCRSHTLLSLPVEPHRRRHLICSLRWAAKPKLDTVIIDWDERGAVLPVMSQIGSTCFAVVATDVVASAIHIYKRGGLDPLSIDEILDSTKLSGFGDNGEGNIMESFYYMKSSGISREQDYPFIRSEKDFFLCPRLHIDGFSLIRAGREYEMLRILREYHPLAVRIVHHKSLSCYKQGIFIPPTHLHGEHMIFHSMSLVGAGTYEGKPVWLLKNSWGVEWGMSGFCLFPRDGTFAGCLEMNMTPCFPLVGPHGRYQLQEDIYAF